MEFLLYQVLLVKMKKCDDVSGIGTCMRKRINAYNMLVRKPEGKVQLEDLCMDEGMMLK
jgi:hypothetical protein